MDVLKNIPKPNSKIYMLTKKTIHCCFSWFCGSVKKTGASVFTKLLYYFNLLLCLVTESCPTLQPHELQHARILSLPLSPGVCSNSCPLSQWCYLTISTSAAPFSLQSFPASESFKVSWLLAKVLELQLQHQSFLWILRSDFLLELTGLSPCSPRDSQESSPASKFESINSSAFSLFYGPNLTSIHDSWKNHNFGYFSIAS